MYSILYIASNISFPSFVVNLILFISLSNTTVVSGLSINPKLIFGIVYSVVFIFIFTLSAIGMFSSCSFSIAFKYSSTSLPSIFSSIFAVSANIL